MLTVDRATAETNAGPVGSDVGRRVARQALIAAAFVLFAVMLRGGLIGETRVLNPDEIELMAQARAAMRDPVPFTTWTTATTGPYWPLFLAIFGWLGFPMTAAFGHLLAAGLYGVLGYLGFTLARPGLGTKVALLITLFWWVPLVFVVVNGGTPGDFGALNTETLPVVLLLAAALVLSRPFGATTWGWVVVGLLSGFAIGAKYQAAPLALAIVATHLFQSSPRSWRDWRSWIEWQQWRDWIRPLLLWFGGVVGPALLLGLAMLVTPGVSGRAIRIHLAFFNGYGSQLSAPAKLTIALGMIVTMHVLVLVAIVAGLAIRSTGRVALGRAGFLLAGVATVYPTGSPYAHYMIFMYAAVALAIGLPLDRLRPVVAVPVQDRVALVVGMVILAVVGYGVSFGGRWGMANLTGPGDLKVALSSDANASSRNQAIARACPPGSDVVVWGWASELYVNYNWRNAIPFLNTIQITSTPDGKSLGQELVRQSITHVGTDCVVDAVGPPFFTFDKTMSLTSVYPALETVMRDEYTQLQGNPSCQDCRVWVRR